MSGIYDLKKKELEGKKQEEVLPLTKEEILEAIPEINGNLCLIRLPNKEKTSFLLSNLRALDYEKDTVELLIKGKYLTGDFHDYLVEGKEYICKFNDRVMSETSQRKEFVRFFECIQEKVLNNETTVGFIYPDALLAMCIKSNKVAQVIGTMENKIHPDSPINKQDEMSPQDVFPELANK